MSIVTRNKKRSFHTLRIIGRKENDEFNRSLD
jgi:hypothetical protein